MKKQFLNIMILFMALALLFPPLTTEAKGERDQQNLCSDQPSVQLKTSLQKLWIDHTIWTRSYIVSAISGLEDQEKVLAKLLKNQDDIGNAIKPYYGDAAGNRLAELLREHILIGGKVVDAAKSGNQDNLNKYNTEWYKNADDIALFLSKANPNWSNAELKDMLHMHLKLVTDQVVTRLNKDWDAEILAYDEGEDHMIEFADILTKGIIKQFPNKFQQ